MLNKLNLKNLMMRDKIPRSGFLHPLSSQTALHKVTVKQMVTGMVVLSKLGWVT